MSREVCFEHIDGSTGKIVCRISADPDEPGRWSGTCADYQRRQVELAAWQTSPHPRGPRPETLCKHMVELYARAGNTGRVNITRHRPTPAGRYLAQHCRCGGGQERALELYTPPPPAPAVPPPAAGAPSRNKPCPCGSISAEGRPQLYKWCHGAEPGDSRIPSPLPPWPPGLPLPPGVAPPAPPAPPPETTAEKKKRKAKEARETRAIVALEKRRQDRIRQDEIRAADEARRAKRAAAERDRKARRKAEADAKAAAEAQAKAERGAVEYAIRKGKVKKIGAYYTGAEGTGANAAPRWSNDQARAARWPTWTWEVAGLAAWARGRVVKIKRTR